MNNKSINDVPERRQLCLKDMAGISVWVIVVALMIVGQIPACGSSGNASPDVHDVTFQFDATDGSGAFDASDVSCDSDASNLLDASSISDISDTQTVPPRAVFIVFAKEPSQFDSYLLLSNEAVAVSYRSPSPHPADQDIFEVQGRSYFFTAASSDYPNFEKEPLYVDTVTIDIVATRPHCLGFYLHEVMTLTASKNNWDWQVALKEFDWTWMDHVVAEAKLGGKKVIWSEPSYAWQTLDESPVAATRFASYGKTLIPMFATNFPTQIDNARQHARAVADRYSLTLGQSHQSWYFIDSGLEVTREGSFDLAKKVGWDYGAKYFQFEGTSMDLYWESPYMLGIRDFSAYLLKN